MGFLGDFFVKVKQALLFFICFTGLYMGNTIRAHVETDNTEDFWNDAYNYVISHVDQDQMRPALSLQVQKTWSVFSYQGHEDRTVALISRLKLRSKWSHQLTGLSLTWEQGDQKINPNLKKCVFSLYRKDKHHPLIPIEKLFLTQGTWDSKNEKLTFKLDKKIVGITEYFVIASFPPQYEAAMRDGQLGYSEKFPIEFESLKETLEKN